MAKTYTWKKTRFGCRAILRNGQNCGALDVYYVSGWPCCDRSGHYEQVLGDR